MGRFKTQAAVVSYFNNLRTRSHINVPLVEHREELVEIYAMSHKSNCFQSYGAVSHFVVAPDPLGLNTCFWAVHENGERMDFSILKSIRPWTPRLKAFFSGSAPEEARNKNKKAQKKTTKTRTRRHNDPDTVLDYSLFGDFKDNPGIGKRLDKTAASGSRYTRVYLQLDTALPGRFVVSKPRDFSFALDKPSILLLKTVVATFKENKIIPKVLSAFVFENQDCFTLKINIRAVELQRQRHI